MTNAEIKAISEVLTYVARMVADIRTDTKVLRRNEEISRQSTAAQLRRLREQVAKLRAEKSNFRKIVATLKRIDDGANPAHERAIKKEFAIKKNNPK